MYCVIREVQKKKQFGICTVDYYDLATEWFCLYDWGNSKIETAAKEPNCSEEEIYTLIEKKLEPIQEQIIEEFKQTEEYKTHEKHEKITTLHAARKVEFNAAVYLVQGIERQKLKEIGVLLEETHPLGRLFDVDVLKENLESVGRTEIGATRRKCLLCNGDAKVCGRSRAHTVQELQEKVASIIRNWEESL